MNRAHPVAAAALLAVVLAGCGPATGPTEQASQGTPTATPTTSAPTATPSAAAPPSPVPSTPSPPPSSSTTEPVVPAALRWRARTVSRVGFDAADLAGRPTVLWFWAPWCPVCRGQIPQVKGLAEQFGGRANLVGVGSLDDPDAIIAFAAEVPEATHLLDPDGELWKRYRVVEQSSFVLLDPEGEVVVRIGYGGADDLDERVETLLR